MGGSAADLRVAPRRPTFRAGASIPSTPLSTGSPTISSAHSSLARAQSPGSVGDSSPAQDRGFPSSSSPARGPTRQPGPVAAPDLSLYTGLPRVGGQETCRAGDSFAGLPPTRGCFALLKVPGLGKCFPFHSWPERLLPRC